MANMSADLRFINHGPWTTDHGPRTRKKIAILFLVLWSLVLGPLSLVQAKERTLFDLPAQYKQAKFQFFPIPFIETDPGAGIRYGLMPTFLWYDQADQLITIGVAALTHNPKVVGLGGFVGLYFYPSAHEMVEFFFATAQEFERDYYFRYINETWLQEKLDVEVELEYMRNPFERFFGFGPATTEANETNFVSHLSFWTGRVAYEFLPDIDVQLEEKWVRMDLNPHAITTVNDTATTFANNDEVVSSNQWPHRLSLIWDTRDSRQFPKDGHYLETYGLFAPTAFDSNPFYSGYGLLAKEIFTLNRRFTTVMRLSLEQMFGSTIPFYMQPKLGGSKNLRSFVKRRFTGRGLALFDVEERILIRSWQIMKAKFDFSIDPFVAVGQVFNQWSQLDFDNLQPVGGVGFRALVPPSVVGRVDVAFGSEGLNVYTTLNYPF